MISPSFAEEVARWFPELCGSSGTPDLEARADVIILDVLNFGDNALTASAIAHYGIARVQAVAIARVNRLNSPAFRLWKERFLLPEREAMVELFQSLWLP